MTTARTRRLGSYSPWGPCKHRQEGCIFSHCFVDISAYSFFISHHSHSHTMARMPRSSIMIQITRFSIVFGRSVSPEERVIHHGDREVAEAQLSSQKMSATVTVDESMPTPTTNNAEWVARNLQLFDSTAHERPCRSITPQSHWYDYHQGAPPSNSNRAGPVSAVQPPSIQDLKSVG